MTTLKPKTEMKLSSTLVAFLMPTLLGKCAILYFGLNYSDNPGEGYGVGLAIAIVWTLASLGLFVWKYWDYEEER